MFLLASLYTANMDIGAFLVLASLGVVGKTDATPVWGVPNQRQTLFRSLIPELLSLWVGVFALITFSTLAFTSFIGAILVGLIGHER